MVALCVWLLVTGCFSLDRKRETGMRLLHASSLVNRSSRRVPKVMLGSGNVSASGRVPGAGWPDSSPGNCDDFLGCVGGAEGAKLGAKLGECCAKWADDSVVWNTYCQVVGNAKQTVPLRDICYFIRAQCDKDDDAKSIIEGQGLSLGEAVAACDALCNSVPENSKAPFCDVRALKDCLKSSNEGVCLGKYYNSRQYAGSIGVVTTFDYRTDCLTSDGVPTPGKGGLCKDFCDNINKDIEVSGYDWDDYCGEAQAFRECVGANDVGKCCALHPSDATDCLRALTSHCVYPSIKASSCDSYCANIDPYSSKSSGFCGTWGYAKCTAGRPTTAFLPECCAYQTHAQQHCSLKIYNTGYEKDTPGYETAVQLTQLCSDLRDPRVARFPCGLEVSKSTLDGYCTTLCDNLDQNTRRSYFWWCDADAQISYLACRAGVDVGEYVEEQRRLPTYHSRYFSYDPYQSLRGWAGNVGHSWETEAKCCGENPAAAGCAYGLRACEQLYDSKYNDQRDEIDDFEFPEISEVDREDFETAAEFCKSVCRNMDNEPKWCDNLPTILSPAAVAAIVLGCILFLAIVGIVVLVILYVKKPRVGAAPSAE